jgi:hypothetical protein
MSPPACVRAWAHTFLNLALSSVAPAAVQGSSALATASGLFGADLAGQVPDLQLGYVLPITTRAILCSAQGTRFAPQDQTGHTCEDKQGGVRIAGCKFMRLSWLPSAYENPHLMIEGLWHSVPNRTGSLTASKDRWAAWRHELLRLRSDHASGLYLSHEGKRQACPREAETPNHGLSP